MMALIKEFLNVRGKRSSKAIVAVDTSGRKVFDPRVSNSTIARIQPR